MTKGAGQVAAHTCTTERQKRKKRTLKSSGDTSVVLVRTLQHFPVVAVPVKSSFSWMISKLRQRVIRGDGLNFSLRLSLGPSAERVPSLAIPMDDAALINYNGVHTFRIKQRQDFTDSRSKHITLLTQLP